MKYGYMHLQNTPNPEELQQEMNRLNQEGVSTENIIIGSLDQVFQRLQPGDTLILCSVLGAFNSPEALLSFLQQVAEKGIYFQSLNQAQLIIDPSKQEVITLLRVLHELQSALRSHSSKKGLVRAVAEGKRLGRPEGITPRTREALALFETGQYTVSEVCQKTGCNRGTIYRLLRKQGKSCKSSEAPQSHRGRKKQALQPTTPAAQPKTPTEPAPSSEKPQ